MNVSFVLSILTLLTLAAAEHLENEESAPVTALPSQSNVNIKSQKEFGGNLYEILRSGNKQLRLEYKDAVEACTKTTPDSSALLVVKSQAETDFLVNWLFREEKIEGNVWLDLTRVNGTNDFVWASEGLDQTEGQGQTEYRNWHKCEPNDITVTKWKSPDWPENCVEMYPLVYPYPLRCDVNAEAGQWNDIPCTRLSRTVVCQRKIIKDETNALK